MQLDQFELRSSNHRRQELILIWPLPTDHQAEELNQFTTLVIQPTNELNDCLRYIHENDHVTKLFFIIGDGADLSADQRIESLRSSLRQSSREIRLITLVWNQNNAGLVEHINDTGRYFNDFSQLCFHLEEALLATNSDARSLAGSTMSLDSVSADILDWNSLDQGKISIFCRRLLVRTLLALPQPRAEIERGLNRLRDFYADEPTTLRQIHRFEQEYFLPDRAFGPIWWFTRGNFLSQSLQRALKTRNIKHLFLLRFFIRDLYDQLRNLQASEVGHGNLTVYRSMIPTAGDRPRADALITMDTFLSTSTSLELAEIFAEPSSIIFEIHTGVREETGFVFGNLAQLITDISPSSVPLDQQEVLFELYTSFRVHGIRTENNRQYVALHLLGREELDRISAEVEEGFRNELCGSETWLGPGEEWTRRGNISNAADYYQELFAILLSNAEQDTEPITERLRRLCDYEQERIQRSRYQLSETVELSDEA